MAVVIPDETLYAAHLTAAELKQELPETSVTGLIPALLQ